MKKILLFITVVLTVILLFKTCNSSTSLIDSYLGFQISKDTLDDYFTSKMKEYRMNGLTVAIINDGKVRYHTTKGVANKGTKLPVTPKTIFEGASISKSVFSFFIMTFVEDKTLDLDKPLYQYLPNKAIAYDERYKKITARMVLSHRSGFQNWREDDDDKKLKIQFEPGTEYFYSGEGYQYLAEILKHLLKTDWKGLEKEFQKRIGIPLEMKNTVFIQNEYIRKHKAEPYDKDNKWIDWKNNYWFKKEDTVFMAPASIHSEPIDFSKWMIAVMNKDILSQQSYEEMLKPHSKIPYDGINVSYTLGFVKPHIPFTNLYLHSGNNIGFTSSYALDTEKKWGFVLFTNSEYGEKLGEELLFYMLSGPNKMNLYLFLNVIIFGIITILVFAISFIKGRINLKKR